MVSVCLIAQFVFVLLQSGRQYTSFALSSDFAQYDQAIWLIAHGHLNPWSSTNSIPFNDTYFSLITYPLGLVFWIWPNGLLLLWLQDAAGVAAELVALLWVWEIAVKRPPFANRNLAPVALIGSAAVILFNPYFYEAMFFGVHPEVFCAIFVVLVLRDAWNHRFMRAAIWAVLVLLTGGDLGGLYLIGIGLTLLLALPRRWWLGAAAVAVGFSWFRLTQILGVSRNSVLSGYSYLTAPRAVSLPNLIEALITHPLRWLQILWERRLVLYQNLIPTGLLGLVSPWSVGTIVVILVSSALIYPLIFVESGFQNFPVYVVGIAGTALVWCALSQGDDALRRGITSLLGLAIVAQSVIFGCLKIPSMPAQWITVSSAQAKVLTEGLDRIPPQAEVIADSGVIGRFSQRQWVYNIYPLPLKVPINEPYLVFVTVLPQSSGDEPLNSAQVTSVIDYLTTELHAKSVAEGAGVHVLSWHSNGSSQFLTLPG